MLIQDLCKFWIKGGKVATNMFHKKIISTVIQDTRSSKQQQLIQRTQHNVNWSLILQIVMPEDPSDIAVQDLTRLKWLKLLQLKGMSATMTRLMESPRPALGLCRQLVEKMRNIIQRRPHRK